MFQWFYQKATWNGARNPWTLETTGNRSENSILISTRRHFSALTSSRFNACQTKSALTCMYSLWKQLISASYEQAFFRNPFRLHSHIPPLHPRTHSNFTFERRNKPCHTKIELSTPGGSTIFARGLQIILSIFSGSWNWLCEISFYTKDLSLGKL